MTAFGKKYEPWPYRAIVAEHDSIWKKYEPWPYRAIVAEHNSSMVILGDLMFTKAIGGFKG